MKKLILTPILFLVIFLAHAQLNVTGQATLSVQPERTTISYAINETKDSYDEALTTMTNRIDVLTKSLTKIGFKKEDIKTSNFNIRQNRKYRQNEPKGFEYVASQTLMIEFDHSTKRLLEVLNKTASDEAAPGVSISFGMSDEQTQKVKTQLMQMAVSDAKAKAETLASATGYTIKGIKEINYGSGSSQPRPYAASQMGMMKSFAESDMSNFEAQDLTVSDQVFISYEIMK
ncbi:SIMPL domain-containing protein [Reichenbachiella carrageenanivorans]|uniref:SIMPL domain-containing protein n=1 Tax=Reichenbachiella carrageenanivorans TaxID=2979869 RepID=A0ABY6CWV7_9BACT|nr:SIMPL domain-containing protein [Reichenbachiella carrageenanivorans]UXX78377.1 SIMPL domain-containing protein [Reichenbachiella carrageenanivorans]